MLVFALVALLVGAFMIFNTFSITVAQRTRENGLLRALGASRRQILLSVLLEAFVVGVIASLLGIIGGLGVAVGLKALLAAVRHPGPRHGGRLQDQHGGDLAGRRYRRHDAGGALAGSQGRPGAPDRRDAAGPRRQHRLRLQAAHLSSAAGCSRSVSARWSPACSARWARPSPWSASGALLVFFGVSVLGRTIALPLSRAIGSPLPRLRGVTGELARENAMRNPKRTAASASALMIGVGLVGVHHDLRRVDQGLARAGDQRLVHRGHRGDLRRWPARRRRPEPGEAGRRAARGRLRHRAATGLRQRRRKGHDRHRHQQRDRVRRDRDRPDRGFTGRPEPVRRGRERGHRDGQAPPGGRRAAHGVQGHRPAADAGRDDLRPGPRGRPLPARAAGVRRQLRRPTSTPWC